MARSNWLLQGRQQLRALTYLHLSFVDGLSTFGKQAVQLCLVPSWTRQKGSFVMFCSIAVQCSTL